MAEKNPHLYFLSTPAPGKKPSSQVPMVGDRPHNSHAKEEIKLRLSGRNKKHEINTKGGINRKTVAVDTNKVNQFINH